MALTREEFAARVREIRDRFDRDFEELHRARGEVPHPFPSSVDVERMLDGIAIGVARIRDASDQPQGRGLSTTERVSRALGYTPGRRG